MVGVCGKGLRIMQLPDDGETSIRQSPCVPARATEGRGSSGNPTSPMVWRDPAIRTIRSRIALNL